MQGGGSKAAEIAIPSPLKEPLTYSIPPQFRDEIRAGMRVLVPLGKRKVTGVVMSLLAETPKMELKEIITLLDPKPVLDPVLLKLLYWVSRYYLSPLGETLAAALPASLRSQIHRTIVRRDGDFPISGRLEREILAELEGKGGKSALKSLARRFPGRGFYRALNRLEAVGALETREREVKKRKREELEPPEGSKHASGDGPKLSPTLEQERALRAIRERLKTGGFETFLLYGVTGSGKTEVYLRAMEEAKKAQKRSLILVPEISLTPQLLDRLGGRFPGRVGVLHSGLTPSERWGQWRRILDGRVDVVVGARSAIFAPIPDLGLIVVDEEHDPSYKQEEGLRYHARDLAVVRAKLVGCPVVLGSATPAIESFENCRRGRYRLLELTHRVEQRALPQVEAVDLRREPGLFSPRLKEALQENHARGRQSLIFLNRRGFANFLQCHLCGFVLRCDHCSVTMTFHLGARRLLCHHCGASRQATDLCPGCGNLSLCGIGFGTEQVEKEISQIIAGARVGRLDRDTTGRRGVQERLFRQWERGEIDLLVGTQMVTKGHDVAGVTLVAALIADLSLNLPDFRAAERTFQLLSQVAGRAGRGDEPGRVIIQTYMPDHYAFQYIITHDYKGFFDSEIEFRRALNYPPFSRLVQLRIDGPKAREVEAQARRLGDGLRGLIQRDQRGREAIEILGPAPAPIEKLRGRYRWQILLKGQKAPPLLSLAAQAREILRPSRSIRLHIDVDPYSML